MEEHHAFVDQQMALDDFDTSMADDALGFTSKDGANGRKRKRVSNDGDRSTASEEAPETVASRSTNGAANANARPSPLKRACNECRQQKLRCDVQVDPNYQDCSRCKRLRLTCRIDANFRRIGKRSRNAEMEREIQELRKETAEKDARIQELEKGTPGYHNETSTFTPVLTNAQILANDRLTALHQDRMISYHNSAAGTLVSLKNSGVPSTTKDAGGKPEAMQLGNINLSADRISELFKEYFTFYHPFLPLLDPTKPWEYYVDISPLLFWTVISVAVRRHIDDPTLLVGLSSPLVQLVWSTIAQVPQNYHVVKAFCLLCTWPLPTKSTSTDPTFMYSGLMMSIALQVGLHRPSHVQDFSRIRVELREDDIRDRLSTWACCNIVSQAVSTGYGQPPRPIYDWTLTSLQPPQGDDAPLTPTLYWRLQIERFCNRISQKFYVNRTDFIGLSSDQERRTWMSVFVGEYNDLEGHVKKLEDPITTLHLLAAGLHLRLIAFFDSSTFPNYLDDLVSVYHATTRFLTHALELNAPASTSGSLSGGILSPSQTNSPFPSYTGLPNQPTLIHVGFYILQLLLAGGFVLMKLLNSFFAYYIDSEAARRLFNATVRSIRSISLSNNDLPARLAEVLTQLWRSSGAGQNRRIHGEERPPIDDSLQLKVRCRMSISLLFDSVWRWREEKQFPGGRDNSAVALANLDRAAENPTDPEAEDHAAGAPATPAPAGTTSGFYHPTGAGASNGEAGHGMLAGDATLPSAALGNDLGSFTDLNYEVFDPLTWVLDGDLDFPYEGGNGAGGMFGGQSLG